MGSAARQSLLDVGWGEERRSHAPVDGVERAFGARPCGTPGGPVRRQGCRSNKRTRHETEPEPPYGGRSLCRSTGNGRSAERRRRRDEPRRQLHRSGDPEIANRQRRRIQSHERASARDRPADAVVRDHRIASGQFRTAPGGGSPFIGDSSKAGQNYAGSAPQNSRNTASVSQYDVACANQPH